ncbi:MAG: hypothetical protein GXY48_01810 [Methanomicrobiales archaeon]|nr:hypothetical protein [Methanomicrobiales archaeon]
MKKKIFGIVGLIFGIIAILTGVYALYLNSLFMAGGYLFFVAIVGVLFTRFFCASCPIKDTCIHILPGYIARIWKERPGPYTPVNLLISGFLFVIIFLPPLPALIRLPVPLLIFLVCIGLAALTSIQFLCPECENRFCPFRR